MRISIFNLTALLWNISKMHRNREDQTAIPASPPLGGVITSVLQSCFITSLRAPSPAFFPLWLEYLKANCRHHTMRAIKKKKNTTSEIIIESEEIAETVQHGHMYPSPSCNGYASHTYTTVSKPGIDIGVECVCVHMCVYMHRLASVHT